jgi:hypothetical protein
MASPWLGIIMGTTSRLGLALVVTLLVLAHRTAFAEHDQGSASPAVPAPPTPSNPRTGGPDPVQPTVLAFDPPSVEFGPMYVGKTRHASVKVTNSSDAPVMISRTIPGCPCTKASDPPKEPLAPGASFTIDVSLDGGDYGGTKLRKVVNFLIEGRPTEFLWLHGDVQKVIAVNPQVIDARKSADGDTLKVMLESARFVDFTVLGVDPAGIVTFGKDRSTEHELTIDVAALKAAGMPTKLAVTTDHPDADVIFVLLRVPPPPAPPAASPQQPGPPPPAAPAPPSPPDAAAPPRV